MREPRHGRRAALVWAGLTVLGVLAVFGVRALLPGTLPVAASQQAADENFTLLLFTIIGVPIAMVVWGLAGYSLVVWRRRGAAAGDGAPIHRNPRVQLTWIVVTSALTLFFVAYGLTLLNTASAAARPLVVEVTGQQWMWTFRYPDDGGVASADLVLPLDRPVLFRVTSTDVNHSFWVPSLGVKIDANGGEVTTTSTTPTRLGTYRVECAELCGLYHAYMESKAEVVSPGAFDAWVKQQGGATS